MNQIQCNRCKVLVVDASDDWLLAKKKKCAISVQPFIFPFFLSAVINICSYKVNIVAALGLLT